MSPIVRFTVSPMSNRPFCPLRETFFRLRNHPLSPRQTSHGHQQQSAPILGQLSVVDSSATLYSAGATCSTREPRKVLCRLISSFVQRLPPGRIDSALEATDHHPCKFRKLATKHSATMRGHCHYLGSVVSRRVSALSRCPGRVFSGIMFTSHESSCLRVKWH